MINDLQEITAVLLMIIMMMMMMMQVKIVELVGCVQIRDEECSMSLCVRVHLLHSFLFVLIQNTIPCVTRTGGKSLWTSDPSALTAAMVREREDVFHYNTPTETSE